MITGIHAGHTIRSSLQPWLMADDVVRLREEDPLTDYFLSAGDTIVRANRSRFEFDLNRPPDKAVTTDPEDIWGLRIWDDGVPDTERRHSLTLYREFYQIIAERVKAMLAENERILVLDLHSYNHRRNGRHEQPADPDENPDIDLGATTLNKDIYGGLLNDLADALRSRPVRGRELDVRTNVRWDDGGHFPEWLHAEFGDAACVITLEYKKIFMDEWGHTADILAMQDLREGFLAAVEAGRVGLAANSEAKFSAQPAQARQ